MSLREVDRIRAERYLREGKSWQEIEAMIPGIDLDTMQHPTEEQQAIIEDGRVASSSEYLRGRLIRILDNDKTGTADKVDILLKLLGRNA